MRDLANDGATGAQFIIITHDKEFVQYLCGSANVERFYRVTKNAQGYSQVEKKGSKAGVGKFLRKCFFLS